MYRGVAVLVPLGMRRLSQYGPSCCHSLSAPITVLCLCINKPQEDFRPPSISEDVRFALNLQECLLGRDDPYFMIPEANSASPALRVPSTVTHPEQALSGCLLVGTELIRDQTPEEVGRKTVKDIWSDRELTPERGSRRVILA